MTRIGILTGGGDVPGLNSIIKSVVYRGWEIGWGAGGVRRGRGGPAGRPHHEPADWEKLVVALNAVLSRRRWRTVHESRRAIEELGDDYNRLAYFERTAQALANLMYEKGALHRDEVSARMDAIRKRLSK